MMDREHGAQQKMLCVTMESLMPEKHFLRDLDRLVDFRFVYDKVAELYSNYKVCEPRLWAYYPTQ